MNTRPPIIVLDLAQELEQRLTCWGVQVDKFINMPVNQGLTPAHVLALIFCEMQDEGKLP